MLGQHRRACAAVVALVLLSAVGAASPTVGASARIATTSTRSGTVANTSWPQERFNARRTAFDPSPSLINSGNVATLALRRAYSLAGSTYTAGVPAVVGGVVYVTGYSFNGPTMVYAFPESCGGAAGNCAPIWSATMGLYGATTPAVFDGMVYVGSDDGVADAPTGRLYAFDAACGSGGATCSPTWIGDTPGAPQIETPPTVSEGVVYVNNGSVQSAYLYAFGAHCGMHGATCPPLWRGKMIVGDAFGGAAVADGIVYVPDYYGYILGFDTTCPRHTVCPPVFSASVGSLGPGAVAIASGLVIAGSQNNDVYAFSAHCRGSCPPVWTAITHSNVRSSPAIANGEVYIASDDGTLYAYPLSCQGICHPTWTAYVTTLDSFWSSPVVSNGIVYVSWTDAVSRYGIAALATNCAVGGGSCTPLWNAPEAGNFLYEGPAMSDSQLFVGGGPSNGPGKVFVFGLPA